MDAAEEARGPSVVEVDRRAERQRDEEPWDGSGNSNERAEGHARPSQHRDQGRDADGRARGIETENAGGQLEQQRERSLPNGCHTEQHVGLLREQHHADRREHSANGKGWHELGVLSRAHGSEHELHAAGDRDERSGPSHAKRCIASAERFDGAEHHDDESRGRSLDREMGAPARGSDDAADDGGDDARERWKSACDGGRDAEREREKRDGQSGEGVTP